MDRETTGMTFALLALIAILSDYGLLDWLTAYSREVVLFHFH